MKINKTTLIITSKLIRFTAVTTLKRRNRWVTRGDGLMKFDYIKRGISVSLDYPKENKNDLIHNLKKKNPLKKM